MSATTLDQVKLLLGDVLQLGERTKVLNADSPLFGSIPEFDSMAVVSVLTGLETRFGIVVDDDEINADIFRTVGALATFVETKLVA